MADYILLTGDKVMFNPAFGPAVVVVQPGTLTGSGKEKLNGKYVCVQGDEKRVVVPGCPYISGSFPIPGIGTLKIQSLAASHLSKNKKCDGKPVLLKGYQFNAVFEVTTPAQMPPPVACPDPMSQYSGTGSFLTENVHYTAD